MTMNSARFRSRLLWILLGACALVSVAAFFVPAVIIRPFAYQSPRGLLLAMSVRQRAPIISPVFAVLSLTFVWMLWSSSKRWAKVVLSSIMLPVAFSAIMSRLNYFEWMFHPIDAPQFEAESASKLADTEMILAVHYRDDARAYPIREMAYHHILNDVVNGVPIAVTY
jgi:hypothetical protein